MSAKPGLWQEETLTEGAWEQGAGESIWTEEGRSGRRVEKTA
jgi:hypothetical protein